MQQTTPAGRDYTLSRIAVLDDYQGYAMEMADWSAVKARAEVVVFRQHLSEDEAAVALADFDAICCIRERMALPASLLRRLPRLRFIGVTGAVHRTLDMECAKAQGILVSNTNRRGSGAYATAELAWGMILSLARNLPSEMTGMKKGGWQTSCGISIGGRTLGVLGLGRLGSHMVPVARAFGMNVIAWSQNLTPEKAAAAGAQWVDKETLFREADFLSLHVVLSQRTRHIVGAHELALMKPTAYIVNTARGPLIDRDALIAAVTHKRIAGVALDTFDVEPLPDDDALRTLDNVWLTPHLGYTVRELLVPFYEDTVENLLAYMDGKPVRLLSGAESH